MMGGNSLLETGAALSFIVEFDDLPVSLLVEFGKVPLA